MLWLVLQIKETALEMELVTESVLFSDFFKIVKILHERWFWGKKAAVAKTTHISIMTLTDNLHSIWSWLPKCLFEITSNIIFSYMAQKVEGWILFFFIIIIFFFFSKESNSGADCKLHWNLLHIQRLVVCCKIYHHTLYWLCHSATVQISAWTDAELASA